jgi:hypothetical protein
MIPPARVRCSWGANGGKERVANGEAGKRAVQIVDSGDKEDFV